MPYIQQSRRDEIRDELLPPDSVGELNFLLTTFILQYLKDPNSGNGGLNYEKYNSVMGVLECVKQELYRRMIAPYEDKKIEENGDVYV